MKNYFLCNKNDIQEGETKGFSINNNPDKQDIFVVKKNEQLFAYKNSCPHTGATLNWQPDIFMDYDNIYIQCSIHGARFEIETGLCVWGPCVNQKLRALKINIVENKIYLAADN